MSNNKKYVVLLGGKECREAINSPHWKFAKDSKDYALTEVMQEGVEFDGSEVWQVKDNTNSNWCTEENSGLDTFGEFEFFLFDRETRIAIKPLKAIEPVKEAELSPYFLNKIKHMEENVYGPGDNNYGRDKKSWDKEPPTDAVENKKESDVFSELYCALTLLLKAYQSDGKDDFHNLDPEQIAIKALGKADHYKQQSQSIEGIVVFVLEWVADKDFIDKQYIPLFKSDIIKKYNNGK